MPECKLPMNFMGRYIVEVRLESAAPSHLKDYEAWSCEKCEKLYVDPGDGQPHETESLPKGALP
ncbi:MAG: hypothetical protein ABSF82_08320 [Candidatus Bathyarchaeia archaeon]